MYTNIVIRNSAPTPDDLNNRPLSQGASSFQSNEGHSPTALKSMQMHVTENKTTEDSLDQPEIPSYFRKLKRNSMPATTNRSRKPIRTTNNSIDQQTLKQNSIRLEVPVIQHPKFRKIKERNVASGFSSHDEATVIGHKQFTARKQSHLVTI